MFSRALPLLTASLFAGAILVLAQQPASKPPSEPHRAADAVQDAQTPRSGTAERPEQKKSAHDKSDVFAKPRTINPAVDDQAQKGRVLGFDFARDPFDAKRPMQTFEEVMKADVDAKGKVMELQRKLLESTSSNRRSIRRQRCRAASRYALARQFGWATT